MLMLLLVRAVGDESKIVAIVRCSNLILIHLSHMYCLLNHNTVVLLCKAMIC